ncbi:MAG: hypothetical protein K9L28_01265 [Synergistales bacterium]|nr:hypothetical protein [Synergistales bacterium]
MKGLGIVLALVAAAMLPATPAVCAQDTERQPLQVLNSVETTVYGSVASGGLLPRLAKVEKDLFGRELPGSIAERQQALLDFLRTGSASQPSLLFKVDVAEWAINQRCYPRKPLMQRVQRLEEEISGTSRPSKPLAMRLERLMNLLFGDAVGWEKRRVDAGTLLKVRLNESLSPSTAQKGDVVTMSLVGSLAKDTHLVAPAGSLVYGEISEVKQPRSFGRSAEINVRFRELAPLGPTVIPVTVGDRAKKAAEADKSVVAAAGTSMVGLALLGPVGLAGGFFVRGEDKELPEGTMFYLETKHAVETETFPVPEGLQSSLETAGMEAAQEAPEEESADIDSRLEELDASTGRDER